MTRAELLRRMSCAEFVQWAAFYRKVARDQERAQKRGRSKH